MLGYTVADQVLSSLHGAGHTWKYIHSPFNKHWIWIE